jgi:hypothetical protein
MGSTTSSSNRNHVGSHDSATALEACIAATAWFCKDSFPLLDANHLFQDDSVFKRIHTSTTKAMRNFFAAIGRASSGFAVSHVVSSCHCIMMINSAYKIVNIRIDRFNFYGTTMMTPSAHVNACEWDCKVVVIFSLSSPEQLNLLK